MILQIVGGPFNEGSMPAHQVAGPFGVGFHSFSLFVEVVAVDVDAEDLLAFALGAIWSQVADITIGLPGLVAALLA